MKNKRRQKSNQKICVLQVVRTFTSDGAFWSINSTNPLGMDESPISTLSDFKLYKVGNSTYNVTENSKSAYMEEKIL